MNVQNCKSSLLKLIGFLGVASASALLFLPGLAQANSNQNQNTIVAQAAPETDTDTDTDTDNGTTTSPF